MTGDFDLNSQKWLTLLFADKNREYGAYVHRIESSDRHLKAIIIITTVMLSLIFLPKLVKSIMPAQKDLTQITSVTLSSVDIKPQDIPEENQIKQVEAPPPPEFKTTVKFTPPVITKDEDIREEDITLSQKDLTDSSGSISVQTIQGSNDGVDIADVAEHKAIVAADVEPEVYEIGQLEEKPEFIGGDKKMYEWLGRNIVYPEDVQNVSGYVRLRFVVGPDGAVRDVVITKALNASCDRIAKRAVERMPKWKPGKQNGKPVAVYFDLPIRFEPAN